MPLTSLPEIGDRIIVRSSEHHIMRPAVVISMYECRDIAPQLWWRNGKPDFDKYNPEKSSYTSEDTIRAFKFDDGGASFCIMRFGNGVTHPYEFNNNIEPCNN